jgi:hypothetical protein
LIRFFFLRCLSNWFGSLHFQLFVVMFYWYFYIYLSIDQTKWWFAFCFYLGIVCNFFLTKTEILWFVHQEVFSIKFCFGNLSNHLK